MCLLEVKIRLFYYIIRKKKVKKAKDKKSLKKNKKSLKKVVDITVGGWYYVRALMRKDINDMEV